MSIEDRSLSPCIELMIEKPVKIEQKDTEEETIKEYHRKLTVLLNSLTPLYYTYVSIIEPDLWLGGFINPYNGEERQIDILSWEYKFESILSITDPGKVIPDMNGVIPHLHIRCLDDPGRASSLFSWFDFCADYINNCRKSGKKIFVHCHAGVSRSATIVLAYYLKYGLPGGSKKLADIIRHVLIRRSCIRPNPGFLDALIDYENFLGRNFSKEKNGT